MVPFLDYVAGSMGGLVGGAYATGMHPLEVRELVKSIDWDAVLRGSTEYGDLSFRRKQDSREYPNSLEFGLRHGCQVSCWFQFGAVGRIHPGQNCVALFNRCDQVVGKTLSTIYVSQSDPDYYFSLAPILAHTFGVGPGRLELSSGKYGRALGRSTTT